jgi:hypothetical protein
MDIVNYEQKYLKYKSKYQELKNSVENQTEEMVGGVSSIVQKKINYRFIQKDTPSVEEINYSFNVTNVNESVIQLLHDIKSKNANFSYIDIGGLYLDHFLLESVEIHSPKWDNLGQTTFDKIKENEIYSVYLNTTGTEKEKEILRKSLYTKLMTEKDIKQYLSTVSDDIKVEVYKYCLQYSPMYFRDFKFSKNHDKLTYDDIKEYLNITGAIIILSEIVHLMRDENTLRHALNNSPYAIVNYLMRINRFEILGDIIKILTNSLVDDLVETQKLHLINDYTFYLINVYSNNFSQKLDILGLITKLSTPLVVTAPTKPREHTFQRRYPSLLNTFTWLNKSPGPKSEPNFTDLARVQGTSSSSSGQGHRIPEMHTIGVLDTSNGSKRTTSDSYDPNNPTDIRYQYDNNFDIATKQSQEQPRSKFSELVGKVLPGKVLSRNSSKRYTELK